MKEKRLRIITEILAIIAICLISFFGVYKQDANIMKNKVKKYNIGEDLTGYRELICEISDATEVQNSEGKVIGNTDTYDDSNIEAYSYEKTDTKVNPDEELKTENYQKSKNIIEKRLKNLGIQNYNIGVNKDNGTLSIQIPENDNVDHTISNILQVADFKIKDSEDDSKVFITNDDIKDVKAMYNTTESGTTVYLQIELNKNGKNIFNDLTANEYKTKPEEEKENESEDENTVEDENAVEAEAEVSTEENTTDSQEENSEEIEASSEEEKEEKQKELILSIDNSDMITTSFEKPIEDGIISLSMGNSSTDPEKISDLLQSTSTIATLLNSGKMPLTYRYLSNQYVSTDILDNSLQKVIIGTVIVIGIALLYLIIKYKLKGIIAAISFIGFIGLDLLLIRYTNISITFESLVACVIVLAINYILVYRLLKIKEKDEETKKLAYKNEIISWIAKLLPMFIISIIFVFIKRNEIANFGMFMFWGILLSIIYNVLLTKDMIDE